MLWIIINYHQFNSFPHFPNSKSINHGTLLNFNELSITILSQGHYQCYRILQVATQPNFVLQFPLTHLHGREDWCRYTRPRCTEFHTNRFHWGSPLGRSTPPMDPLPQQPPQTMTTTKPLSLCTPWTLLVAITCYPEANAALRDIKRRFALAPTTTAQQVHRGTHFLVTHLTGSIYKFSIVLGASLRRLSLSRLLFALAHFWFANTGRSWRCV